MKNKKIYLYVASFLIGIGLGLLTLMTGCALEPYVPDETPVTAPIVSVPTIVYEEGYGWGYWYQEVWYPAPDDFIPSPTAVIYWGPYATIPVIYYRVGFGYGYWCDNIWYPAPYGYVYIRGARPYWGPYMHGGYGHYWGHYSPPGIHRGGYFVPHGGSPHYIGPPRRPVAPPVRVVPPPHRIAPPPPMHRGGGYGRGR